MMDAIAILALMLTTHLAVAASASPRVIIIGAGISGISAAKTLSDAGINDLLILEATGRIGGRIRKADFAGVSVEEGAGWVEGVGGDQMNPILDLANRLELRGFISDNSNLSSNTYQQKGGLYERSLVQEAIALSKSIIEAGERFSATLPASGVDDISVLSVPSTPLDMAVDYFSHDGEFAEPPRVTSLQNSEPNPTFTDFGENMLLVADQRGFESVVHYVARQFLKRDKNGTIMDPRLLLNKAVRKISQFRRCVTVTTEDGSVYEADYVMVSVSLGVLQSKLIDFQPVLPKRKVQAIYQFDMTVYTKIYLRFPYAFWPQGNGTEVFLYASERRGYYPIWQQLEKHYPGANILLVTVTYEESRRIEQQADVKTKAEAMEVLRSMFGKNLPDATDILVPRWWSDRFYKGSYSNWPPKLNRCEFNEIRAPVGRVYFTGEHTSQRYYGYAHGAYLAGIDSANMMIDYISRGRSVSIR